MQPKLVSHSCNLEGSRRVAVPVLAQHIPGCFRFAACSYQRGSMLATVQKTDCGELCTGSQRIHSDTNHFCLYFIGQSKLHGHAQIRGGRKGPEVRETGNVGEQQLRPPP